MHSVDINYLAVLVCGIISMATGALWYGPLFGKAWMKETGMTEEDVKDFNPAKMYGMAFVAQLIVALIMAYVISLIGATGVIGGIRVALTAWVGFVAATMMINNLFQGKSTKLFIIDGGYHLVNMLTYGIIIVLW
jgi:hypothetical protein